MDDLCTAVFESERYIKEILHSFHNGSLVFGLYIEDKESASACASELSAESACLDALLVNGIDGISGDGAACLAL